MDPISEHIDPDDSLRLLFHEAGHLAAPAGLEARVLERMAATVPLSRQAPLISPKGWALAAALLVLGFAGAMPWFAPARSFTDGLPNVSVESYFQACLQFISAPWMVAMVVGLAMVMALERLFTAGTSRLIAE